MSSQGTGAGAQYDHYALLTAWGAWASDDIALGYANQFKWLQRAGGPSHDDALMCRVDQAVAGLGKIDRRIIKRAFLKGDRDIPHQTLGDAVYAFGLLLENLLTKDG